MRVKIPTDIKLQVRQKCNFGCIICGCPIYDYEHLVDYSITKIHSVDNIFLMCPNCHRKKTNGEISKEYVLECFSNLQRLTTKPERIIQGTNKILLGNNSIINNQGYIFRLFNNDYLEITQNGLCGKLYNNNKLFFSINNSEYLIHRNAWDVSYSGGIIEFKNAPRKTIFNIQFTSDYIKLTGVFTIKKQVIEISDNGIFVNKMLITSNCTVDHSNYSGFIVDHKINKRTSFLNCINMQDCHSESFDVGFGIEIKT